MYCPVPVGPVPVPELQGGGQCISPSSATRTGPHLLDYSTVDTIWVGSSLTRTKKVNSTDTTARAGPTFLMPLLKFLYLQCSTIVIADICKLLNYKSLTYLIQILKHVSCSIEYYSSWN